MLGMSGTVSANSALNDFDADGLDDAWRSTAILGGNAMSSNGDRVGSVQEMILGEDGLVQSVVITRSPDDSLDQEYLTVEWDNVDFEPYEGEVQLDFSKSAAADREWQELPPIADVGEWKVSRMIGMDVDSTDDVAEGEVEDVLITAKANDMTAFVIESAFTDENYYALPGDPEYVDYEENELDLPFTADTLKDLPDLAY